MRKLILTCGYSPGDIVMMTAAVRDLHRHYPGEFQIDVRTSSPELWENNPLLTPLKEEEAEVLDCSYPLIDQCNWTPYHCLHGYIDFLNKKLGTTITPTEFKGDIYVSELEKSWYSQVFEVIGQDIPFWIVAAGGKYDVTVKWWPKERFQEVVNHFKGKIQFVQVGAHGHYHPPLDGVIDLRGRTSLRELVRLVYHAQGVLCPVTALMHLAAAVEMKHFIPRACVVIAGGREPAHWEAYPDHQFIHSNGALFCCSGGGCWKDRVIPLRDGDERDKEEHLCVNVVQSQPRCMDLITSRTVVERIDLYFQGGSCRYLDEEERRAARKGVGATSNNDFDDQPLTLHNAGLACDQFVRSIQTYPRRYKGRGIVICGGGAKYFTNAWVTINMLRQLGCKLPIELWHLGEHEFDDAMTQLVAPLDVRCIDASRVRKRRPVRRLAGWELKPYAILHSTFEEVLFLDADNVPVVNPEFLFDTSEFKTTGAIFWPDFMPRSERTKIIWRSCGLEPPNSSEVESGQIVVNKARCWPALSLAMWFNENSDFYYQYLHGDKETFPLAFEKVGTSYLMVPTPIHPLSGTMCQHDFSGRRIFQHRNTDKWNLFLDNKRIDDFLFEEDCRQHIRRLQQLWDGRISRFRTEPMKRQEVPGMRAVILGGDSKTHCLIGTDWPKDHVIVVKRAGEDLNIRQALEAALSYQSELFLLADDSVEFASDVFIRLRQWPMLRSAVTWAGLTRNGGNEIAYDLENSAMIIDPLSVRTPLAHIVSRAAIEYSLKHWDEVFAEPTLKLAVLSARLGTPLFNHVPGLASALNKEPKPTD